MFVFEPGERLVYRAKWFFLPAGEAVIEMLPDASVNGQPARHFAMTTSTNSQVDFFYKIRERQDSFTDLKVTRSLQYRKKSTGEYPRDAVVSFDWTHRTATYSNFGQPEKPVAIQPGTFDPLSLIFAIRTYRLIPGDVLEIPVTDGVRVINTRAIVASRETVTIHHDVYDTLLVIPDMSRLERCRGRPRRAVAQDLVYNRRTSSPREDPDPHCGRQLCLRAYLRNLLMSRPFPRR